MKLGEVKKLIADLPDETEIRVDCLNWTAPLVKIMYDGEVLLLGNKDCHRELGYEFKELKNKEITNER